MPKIEGHKLTPILKPKKSKVVDPPRYPKVINGFESQAKLNYTLTLQKSINEVSKYMVEQKKK
jgi:hypothetical protein